MNESETIWVRHTWNLQDFNPDLIMPAGYKFRPVANAEVDVAIDDVLSAYRSNPLWRPLMAGIGQRLTERILTTLGMPDTDYLAAEYGGRLAAISGIAKSHWTGQNLLTGICVLPSHQRQGLGKYLLGLSLGRLRAMGVRRARVYTENGSLADRKVYSLFGSVREENVEYPGIQPSNNSFNPSPR
jgi:ribosomal protein S18 acetylase RimI-like enzyme